MGFELKIKTGERNAQVFYLNDGEKIVLLEEVRKRWMETIQWNDYFFGAGNLSLDKVWRRNKKRNPALLCQSIHKRRKEAGAPDIWECDISSDIKEELLHKNGCAVCQLFFGFCIIYFRTEKLNTAALFFCSGSDKDRRSGRCATHKIHS